MISFLVSLIALVAGYFIYGAFVESVFGAKTDRKTPAYTQEDSVDFIPLSWSRIFLIQFLNIAGLGPIFGAIMGALFGPAAFLWIVLGSIFAGGVHDYFSGMLSVRHDGKSI
ncbi:carbon starvation CstA family protein [uncultured Methanolobus sp.]|uniref:carbon starvation CstA family protein n=1 Tax=uncultured Methanolobus sp. TaxID=218300 RepID=UPI0029C8ED7B|nr:carbon starvation CstA family protein [uncultured Methanolobus sp.]